MIPIMRSEAIIDDPPDEMNGSGLPVVGKTPMALPMFKNAWATSMIESPPASMAPIPSSAFRAICRPAQRMAR